MLQGDFNSAFGNAPSITQVVVVTVVGLLLLALLAFWAILQRSRSRTRELQRTDGLTGLPNRLQLRDVFPSLQSQVQERRRCLAVFHVGIDHFRQFNDSRGADSGDRLLVETARRLQACAPDALLVARMGSDEFVVVAATTDPDVECEAMARLLVTVLKAPVEVGDDILEMTVSIGISLQRGTIEEHGGVLRQAHVALHEARSRGRNTYCHFEPGMDQQLREQLTLQHLLRGALARKELYLVFQPVAELAEAQLTGFEALLRWRNPELGDVPPSRFVPVAESCGLIGALGEFVLREACRQIREWQDAGLVLKPVAVNLSPLQFERGLLLQAVTGALAEARIDGEWLHLELTESAIMKNPDSHTATLQALRDLGCRIAIDDFGTGYSSLAYLKHLPLDLIKIDRAFVSDMATNANDTAIVNAIIHMARSLGLETLAEGIETPDQLALLRDMGCALGQGYYFSRPLPADECAALLRQAGRDMPLADATKVLLLKR
jgi:diguanylate cyclase (GGDEF)-like protein